LHGGGQEFESPRLHQAWYVYVLRSLRNGRLYTGSTNDLQRRLSEHARGHSNYTKHAGPFELVYKEEYETRLAARQRELFLKSGPGRRELAARLKPESGR
jgi:putative endonuclease